MRKTTSNDLRAYGKSSIYKDFQHFKNPGKAEQNNRQTVSDATVNDLRQSIKKSRKPSKIKAFGMVPVAGVEPAPCCQDWILSPARLPIPSHRQIFDFDFESGT